MRIYWIKIMTKRILVLRPAAERGNENHGRKKRRKAWCLAVFALVLTAIPAVASHHLPAESEPAIPDAAFEIHTHGRLFYSHNDLSAMIEYTGRFEDPELEFRYQNLTLGGYYRIHRNVKIGVFYKLQLNVRHDDDWVEEGPAWLWADTAGRFEHMAIADVTPRLLLPFLPGENWVTSFKIRYGYNFTNAQQTLLARPGITYFWIRDREPFLTLSAQYAAYFSLNFGAVPWYSHGPYINAIYHLSTNVLLDVGIRKQWIYWSESEQFIRDFPESEYSSNIYGPWILEAGVIFRLP